jgi:hypothetical protein
LMARRFWKTANLPVNAPDPQSKHLHRVSVDQERRAEIGSVYRFHPASRPAMLQSNKTYEEKNDHEQ